MKKLCFVLIASNILLNASALEQELKQLDNALKNLSGSLSGKQQPLSYQDVLKLFDALQNKIVETYGFIDDQAKKHIGILWSTTPSPQDQKKAKKLVDELENKLWDFRIQTLGSDRNKFVESKIKDIRSFINPILQNRIQFIQNLILKTNKTQNNIYDNQYLFVTVSVLDILTMLEEQFRPSVEDID